jgi:hypothetical protein
MTLANDKSLLFSGVIYFTAESILKVGLRNFAQIKFNEVINPTSWELYVYQSNTPLNNEDLANLSGPFVYPILFRPGKNKILILSLTRKIVLNFESEILKKNIYYNIQNVTLNVDDLVKNLVRNAHLDYALTYANAYYIPHGNSIKYITFYGDDIGEGEIFRSNLENMVFNRCGLRSLKRENEIMKLGNDGSIQFIFNSLNLNHLFEIDHLLRFLNDSDYIKPITK